MTTCDRWWRWTHKWGRWQRGCPTRYFEPGKTLPTETKRTFVRVCQRCGFPQVIEVEEAGWIDDGGEVR